MTLDAAHLAQAFAPATRADWLAQVEKTLKGETADSLITEGPDGLAIAPLYAQSLAGRQFAPAPRGGEAPWDVRTRVRAPRPAAARAAMLDDLAGGANSVILAIDDGGGDGVAIDSAEALGEALDGVLIDIAPVGLDAGFMGAPAAEWLSEAAKGSPAAPLALHLDPLSAFACLGGSPGPIEAHLIAAATVAVRLAGVHPRASLFLASGRCVHEAGGTPAQELATALAAAAGYARALARAGLGVNAALCGIVLGLSVDGDVLISIAKLRAARLMWARFAQLCAADVPARIEARTSGRMLTRTDPWTNMVRLTVAAFAGAVGGADALVVGAFTDAIGLPTPFARRMARNVQLVLMDEGGLGAVADPVAGAGAFEALSRDLARAAWAEFTAIEQAGGLAVALGTGDVAAKVEAARAHLQADLRSGRAKIVGVTDFRVPEMRSVEVESEPADRSAASRPRLPGPDNQCPPLAPILLEELAA